VLPFGWHAMHNDGIPYRVKNGDTWGSVAAQFRVDVKELIFFNFLTTMPDEVNWYLHHHTGCKLVSPTGNNWCFSSSANPGIIFIPPADHDPIDGDPENICVWTPGNANVFLQRLGTIAASIGGNKGDRVNKLVRVIADAGYPAARNLWYYNPGAIHEYIAFHTGNARRREMTEATKGAFPFKGNSGVAGEWQLFPAADLLDVFACRVDVAAVKARLEWIDEQIYIGWHDMDLVSAQSSQGGGSAFGEKVWDFINHVRLLSEDSKHLYSAFAP